MDSENTTFQPIIGAMMGLTPGCGGAIIVMLMYARGCHYMGLLRPLLQHSVMLRLY